MGAKEEKREEMEGETCFFSVYIFLNSLLLISLHLYFPILLFFSGERGEIDTITYAWTMKLNSEETGKTCLQIGHQEQVNSPDGKAKAQARSMEAEACS